MKIQLDTINKTIKLEDKVKIVDFIKTLKKLLPNGEWEKFTLETHTVINNWNYPIIYETYHKRNWWNTPWYCATNSSNETMLSVITKR